MAIGEFNIDTYINYGREDTRVILWIFFLLSSFFTTIVILNLLVTVMGETYTALNEKKDYVAVSMSIRMMSDYNFLFAWGPDMDRASHQYCFVSVPTEADKTDLETVNDAIAELQKQSEE